MLKMPTAMQLSVTFLIFFATFVLLSFALRFGELRECRAWIEEGNTEAWPAWKIEQCP